MRTARTLLVPVVLVLALLCARRRSALGGAAPGTDAGGAREQPTEAATGDVRPARWRVLRRAWSRTRADDVPLLAAGVAFYAFLSVFPGLIALVNLYGLVADPATVREQVEALARTLPAETAELLSRQLREITGADRGSLGVGLLVSLSAALFTASNGVHTLMKAINTAHDEPETRGLLVRRGTALLLTLGALVGLVVAVGLVAVVPAVLRYLPLGGAAQLGAEVARWSGLVVFAVVALAVLYRYAPDREDPQMVWVSLGSVVALGLWLVGSAGFSLYVSTFGRYGETYGTLAGVAVLLLWLFLTSAAVLVGAEVDAESERQGRGA